MSSGGCLYCAILSFSTLRQLLPWSDPPTTTIMWHCPLGSAGVSHPFASSVVIPLVTRFTSRLQQFCCSGATIVPTNPHESCRPTGDMKLPSLEHPWSTRTRPSTKRRGLIRISFSPLSWIVELLIFGLTYIEKYRSLRLSYTAH